MGAAGSRPGPSEGQEMVANAGVAGGALEQHCEMWEQAHGEPVSRWTMSRAIKHLGWTRKKSRLVLPSATKRSGPPGEEKQAGFQQSSLFFLMSVAPTLL